MLQHCAEALVQHLDGGVARIWTLDESGEVLELQASAGACAEFDAGHSQRADRALGDRRDRAARASRS